VKIRKAVITAAGKNQRTLPLQTLVDRDGTPKTALTIIIEEARQAGVEEVAVIIFPGDEPAYRTAAGKYADTVQFIAQTAPRGYGHAVHCASNFVKDEAFLLLVGDHLYISREARTCAQQLVEVARAESCAVSAVQATHESKLPYFGTIGARREPNRQDLYLIERVVEKPTPTEAEQHLIVPGLRAGQYLCFFGMHVLTPTMMQILAAHLERAGSSGTVPLSPALNQAAESDRYLASELHGRRHDIGAKYGLLNAQLALSFNGKDRDEVMTQLLELLAQK
jgi:UTP--glucose-1-phosphate uridylyltransferase